MGRPARELLGWDWVCARFWEEPKWGALSSPVVPKQQSGDSLGLSSRTWLQPVGGCSWPTGGYADASLLVSSQGFSVCSSPMDLVGASSRHGGCRAVGLLCGGPGLQRGAPAGDGGPIAFQAAASGVTQCHFHSQPVRSLARFKGKGTHASSSSGSKVKELGAMFENHHGEKSWLWLVNPKATPTADGL